MSDPPIIEFLLPEGVVAKVLKIAIRYSNSCTSSTKGPSVLILAWITLHI